MTPHVPPTAERVLRHRSIQAVRRDARARSGADFGSAYADSLAAVGLHPDNPDGMYADLMRSISDPVAFKNDQKGWHGTRDAKIWWEDPKGTAALQWPFHWGLWMKNAPQNDAQLRAVFQIPAGTTTEAFLRKLYSVPASIPRWTLRIESWEGGGIGDLGKWVSNAVNTAGKDIGQATTTAFNTIGKVTSDAVKDIGQAGKGLEDTFDSVGKDFKKVEDEAMAAIRQVVPASVLKDIDEAIKIVKEVAPYAQMAFQTVISFVPAVGPAASAAIGAGFALAEGQPMDEVLMAAAAGAVPGGPIAMAAVKAAQQVAKQALSGKPLTWNALANDAVGVAGSALNLPPEATKGIEAAVAVTAAIVNKKPADAIGDVLGAAGSLVGDIGPVQDLAKQATGVLSNVLPGDLSKGAIPGVDLGGLMGAVDKKMKSAMSGLSGDVQKAIATGLATAIGQHHQQRITPSIQGPALNRCMALGQQVIASDPVVGAMAAKMPKVSIRGFQVGVGAMRYALNTHQLLTLRDALTQGERDTFDTAVSLHIGRVASGPPAGLREPGSHAAFYVTKGMQGAPVAFKVGAMGVMAKDPSMRTAAVVAIKDVAAHRASWWQRLLTALGISHA